MFGLYSNSCQFDKKHPAHPAAAADVADESLRFYFFERRSGGEADGGLEKGVNMEI